MQVVAIDGPVGSGKSTVAKAVADRLSLAHLETGAMYRAVAVAVLRRGVEPTADDPVLAEVAWTWLVEALEAVGATFVAPSGTVTTVTSESFGTMAGEERTAQLEVRASWTPVGDIGPHVEAWGELLCTAVGLEPVPDGVATLASRRSGSRRGPSDR